MMPFSAILLTRTFCSTSPPSYSLASENCNKELTAALDADIQDKSYSDYP